MASRGAMPQRPSSRNSKFNPLISNQIHAAGNTMWCSPQRDAIAGSETAPLCSSPQTIEACARAFRPEDVRIGQL
jgi:hypothetical protein